MEFLGFSKSSSKYSQHYEKGMAAEGASVLLFCLYAVPKKEVLHMAIKKTEENSKKHTKEKESITQSDKKPAESQGLNNTRYKDSSGKTIFEDPILCSQFLRDYVDIPLLKDVQPEDIEDVTERFIHMFTEEREADVVKKVTLKNSPFYVVSLIEHKTDIDYNVVIGSCVSNFR